MIILSQNIVTHTEEMTPSPQVNISHPHSSSVRQFLSFMNSTKLLQMLVRECLFIAITPNARVWHSVSARNSNIYENSF